MASLKLSVTVGGRLVKKYGAAGQGAIDAAVKRWIAADAQRGIKTIHVAVDDAAAMKKLGVKPVAGAATAGKIKAAVDALWARLAPDYLVLVGGEQIVPHFVVANPSYDPAGDDDKLVPTDNPYACSAAFRRSNPASYLVPDRVVGRIPDVPSDSDPAWLVDLLATATNWTSQPRRAYEKAYAICCDAWKGAGRRCVEYLGEPAGQLMISPPNVDGSRTPRARLGSRLHMIKCHGAQLDPNFYGQKGNSYPVALFSGTLRPRLKARTLAAAMCCYGAQVYAPNDPAANLPGQWPLSVSYLRGGAWGFAGATMIAWVGVSEMMCADWIVAGYLKGLLDGASLGRAFLESKQDYVRWINQQGQSPDIADEKTLIEYMLLGDPSIHPVRAAPPAPAANLGARAVATVGPSALVAQERRQRRVVREGMAAQMRQMLPAREPVKRVAKARASKVFQVVRDLLRGEVEAFGMKAPGVRVHKVSTSFPKAPAAARRTLALAGAPAPTARDSFEYYWSGRRQTAGHKDIRLVKVETDAQGNVLRTSVLHSG